MQKYINKKKNHVEELFQDDFHGVWYDKFVSTQLKKYLTTVGTILHLYTWKKCICI